MAAFAQIRTKYPNVRSDVIFTRSPDSRVHRTHRLPGRAGPVARAWRHPADAGTASFADPAGNIWEVAQELSQAGGS